LKERGIKYTDYMRKEKAFTKAVAKFYVSASTVTQKQGFRNRTQLYSPHNNIQLPTVLPCYGMFHKNICTRHEKLKIKC
jgi:hypothetical protein